MIRNIILLFMAAVLSSCYHENNIEVRKPEKQISIDELTHILTDLQIAEGVLVSNRTIQIKTDEEFKDSLYMVIFDHYDITPSVFEENVNYYNSDPALMEKVYNKVLENLNKMQSKIENEARKESEESKENDQENDTLQKE